MQMRSRDEKEARVERPRRSETTRSVDLDGDIV